MNFQISPYERVGPIALGSTQDEVRNAMKCEFKTFMKTPISVMPTDNFIGMGVHVFYRKPGICEAVELAAPANPTIQGYRLLGIPFNQVFAYFQKADRGVELKDDGLTSKLLGIGIWVPELDCSPDALVKGVIVFEKGYYD